jgi:hypothetical protein
MKENGSGRHHHLCASGTALRLLPSGRQREKRQWHRKAKRPMAWHLASKPELKENKQSIGRTYRAAKMWANVLQPLAYGDAGDAA